MSVRITNDYKIECYEGGDDTTNTPVHWYFLEDIPNPHKWEQCLIRLNKITQKEIFTSRDNYENIAIFIDDKIVYDKIFERLSWSVIDNDTEWFIKKMKSLLSYF